jgi:hypothetical protein
MSQTSTAATRYNDGNLEARTIQLRNAKVEEARIEQLVKSPADSGPLQHTVQGRNNQEE